MADNIIKTRIIQKYDTEENWIFENPVLLKGEVAYTSDKGNIYKVGDGVSHWFNLPYIKVGWENITEKPTTFTPSSHTHTKSQITDFPSALKNPNALTISLNSTSQALYDGSSAKTINITPSSIGASATNHTHKYAGSSSVGGDANNALRLCNCKLYGINGENNLTDDIGYIPVILDEGKTGGGRTTLPTSISLVKSDNGVFYGSFDITDSVDGQTFTISAQDAIRLSTSNNVICDSNTKVNGNLTVEDDLFVNGTADTLSTFNCALKVTGSITTNRIKPDTGVDSGILTLGYTNAVTINQNGTTTINKLKVTKDASVESLSATGDIATTGNIIKNAIIQSNTADAGPYFAPIATGTTRLGHGNAKWSAVYANTSSIITSDKNLKNDIKVFDERYESLFLDLEPVTFLFNYGDSGRRHSGFISQHVEEKLAINNLSSFDFAGFCKDPKTKLVTDDDGTQREVVIEGEYVYSLRYEEFIALNTHMIQKIYPRLNDHDVKINALTDRVKLLENILKENGIEV